MNKIGICLIGCGRIGEVHAQEYQGLRDKVKLFVCDRVESKVRKFANRFHAEGWFIDYREALECDEIVAVDICLPHNLHVEVSVESARYGKNILLEKPIATTLEEADRIIEEVNKAGITFMVAENYRFEPAVLKTKELIDQGCVGKPFLIEASSIGYYAPPLWRRNKRVSGGGVLIDRGLHMVDYLHHLGGEVNAIQALVTHETVKEMEGEDTVTAMLQYKSGAVGRLLVSWGILNPPSMPWLIVYGDKGVIYEVPGKRWTFLQKPRLELTTKLNVYSIKIPEYHVKGGKTIELPPINPFREEISHFIDCVLTGKKPKVTGEIARKDLEIVLAIYKSAETKETVNLPL